MIDKLRATFPTLGFSVFAMEPGQPVTLEVYDEGQVFSFTGNTVAAAIEKAFPSKLVSVVAHFPPSPILAAVPKPDGSVELVPVPEKKQENVFD